jgi:hypothetical protein
MAFGPNNNNRKGTGFTNINRVLTANQGNRLGSSVAGGVSNQVQDVRNQTQQSQQKFQEEANKNRLDTDDARNKRDEVIGRFGQSGNNDSLAGTQEVANQVGQNQVQQNEQQSGVRKPIVSQQEIQDFTKYRTGTYTGPQQLNDFQSLLGNASETQQLGDLTRSSGGRQELLRRFVGGEGYNQGQQRLDNLLLGQSGTQGLNEARRNTRGLEQDVSQANTQASNQAQEYVNRAKMFGEETVGKLNEARDPISNEIDKQLAALQQEEQNRQGFYKNIQDTLLGQGEAGKLDRMTQLGLGLQSAMDAGFITQAQANQMLGEGGLIGRAESIGLNTNQLINERLKDIAAQNLNRGGAANAEMEEKISTLDRLLGKQGTDVEFNQAGENYIKGGMNFDLDSLNDYITKSEREKYANDQAKLDKLEAYNQRYLNQAMANAQGAVGSGMQAVGGGLNQMLNPESFYNPGEMGQNLGDIQEGGANALISGSNALAQKDNAILEGLTKLNIGGNSLANTAGGKQLLKAIELKSKLENEATKNASQFTGSMADGTRDLMSGNIIGGIGGITGLTGGIDLTKNLTSNLTSELNKALSNIGIGGGGFKISAPKIRICFAGSTKILMENGKYKNIKDLKLGDKVALGGKIMGLGEGYGDELYNYNGVKVTGGHTVYEDGKWVRVENSEKGYPIGKEEIVYPVTTENHLLVTDGQVWADMDEVDDTYEKTDTEILEELNNNTFRNKKIDKFIKEKFKNGNKKV